MPETLPGNPKAIGDPGHVADHNLIVSALSSIDTRLAAVEGSSSSGLPAGIVWADSYSGTDDQKLASAIAAASARTLKPTIVLSSRTWTFTTPISNLYTGFKLSGWPIGPSVEQPRGNDPYGTRVNVNTGSTTPWLTFPTTAVYGCYLGNMAVNGAGSSSRFAACAGNLTTSVFENLGFANFQHVFGSTSQQFLMTACTWSGFWNINNSYDTAVTIGGSDNTLWTDGCLIDSPPSFMGGPTGKYHLRLAFLSKSTIGPIYMTAETVGGILVTGNASVQGQTVITGARIEGRNAGAPCRGALIRVSGGGLTLRDCWLGFAMSSPSTGANSGDAGYIHQTGGRVVLDGCAVGRATGVAETVPVVYTTSGQTHVKSLITGVETDTWTGVPRVQDAGGAATTIYNDSTVQVV